MSRIVRYQTSIENYIKTRSLYSDLITSSNKLEELLNVHEHEIFIILLTIQSGQYKKTKLKMHHCYHTAFGLDILLSLIIIKDNLHYYEKNYDTNILKLILTHAPIHSFDTITRNMEAFMNTVDKGKLLDIQIKINKYLHDKLITILDVDELKGTSKPHKTDIIKYNFNDKSLIDTNYRKLKIIDKDILIDYVNKTYGTICQCAFVIGWLLGLGDEKMINNLERLGIHLGMLLKISQDFQNLERDLKNSHSTTTSNMIINYGIHKCFDLFDDAKAKLIEGCHTMDIFNITIGEIIDKIESKFDDQLKKTDLELNSRYTSFSD